ncbi:hypothetical protein [Bailinhaonella thermotolerans]|uniref:Uncharacterized protein n=1 Tax=Bailinhaonella thermotolerans TaxID=1070861 RepID=A0A3A4ALG9_9ACTN|nr:hypothetical protein [Bailinhaonella thermotolerans]RJL26510.1 hypothetical protein D5H75_26370 [Bailinhaonella thermotolerans]
MSSLTDPTTETASSSSGLGNLEQSLEEETRYEQARDTLEANGDRGETIGAYAAEEITDTERDALIPPRPLPPRPVPPQIRRHLVRGRYRSGGAGYQLELRVDVDGTRPLKRVSGDFFQTSGGTTTYYGSFIVHSPVITTTAAQVRIEGQGTFTFAAGAPRVRVTIPRKIITQPPGAATVQFFTTSGQPGATYLCNFLSPYFRSVVWEQDSVTGAVPFVSYDTSSLPQPPGSPNRVLTVPKAFAEAGIELQVSGAANVIANDPAGWDDSELHAAMASHFSTFANVPQWKVWLLVANKHVGGYRGIMFDYSDAFQRQGCAVFYDAIKGTGPANTRSQLRTYVHELGHAFNLLHSWQKNLGQPPQPLGPNGGLGDLSWMNYDWKYQPPPPAAGGEAAYWAAFPFQFTDNELIHLRHAYYRNVIMGANAFGVGAAEISPEMFDEPVVDQSGLKLEVRAKEAFEFGEPVVVELKLATTDLRGRTTHGYLHPTTDFVSIAIGQPSGRTVIYRPMTRRCVDEARSVRLDADNPAIYQSAYIGYGRDGHYFQQTGEYHIRAQYVAADGSRIVSDVCRIRVRHPANRADEDVAELMMGEEQGKLLALLGSDSPALRHGNEALDEVIDRHAKHPLAVYARMIRGINAERDFKIITPEKDMRVRQADTKESIQQLTAVAEASAQGRGVDNITLNMVMRRLAQAQAKQGDLEQANTVLDKMVRTFADKRLNPIVLDQIRQQAERTKARLAAEVTRGDRSDKPDRSDRAGRSDRSDRK